MERLSKTCKGRIRGIEEQNLMSTVPVMIALYSANSKVGRLIASFAQALKTGIAHDVCCCVCFGTLSALVWSISFYLHTNSNSAVLGRQRS